MSDIIQRIRQIKHNWEKYPICLSSKQILVINFVLLITSASFISFIFFVINLLLPTAGPKMTLEQINHTWLPYAIIYSGLIMGWSMYLLIKYTGKTKQDLELQNMSVEMVKGFATIVKVITDLTNEIRQDRIERNKKS